MALIQKRDGQLEGFQKSKIVNAILAAFDDVDGDKIDVDYALSKANNIADYVEKKAEEKVLNVEEIQDIVESGLCSTKRHDVAKAYIIYRNERTKEREKNSNLIKIVRDKLNAIGIENSNANMDEASFGGRMGAAAEATSKQIALNYCMSEMAKNNHLNNEIYIHDLSHYPLGDHNCLTIPFDHLLENGFNTRQVDIRPANSISTAMQLVAVIFQLQSLMQFGGVSAGHIDWTMVPYVRKSFFKHFKDGIKYVEELEDLDKKYYDLDKSIEDSSYKHYKRAYNYAKDMLEKEVYQATEALYHNLNSLQSRSGNQLPFTSLNYGTCTLPEGRIITKAILDISIKGLGKLYKTSIFPCGIFQVQKGVNKEPGTPNYDLFQLAIESTSKRLYPNYVNVDWSGNKGWEEYGIKAIPSTMGCRTNNGFDINGLGFQRDGRGNICPVTIILPTLAMEAKKEAEKENDIYLNDIQGIAINKFFKLLEKKIDEAKDMLIERYKWICSQSADSAKFMYENNLMAGYNPEEGIKSALKHGTLALGQLGLAETLQILIEKDHTIEEGIKLAKEIEQLFSDKCNEFKEKYKLNFGVYYSPAESLCHTAMKKFKEKYGEIPNVSDREYFTNSVHVPVWKNVSPFEKIDIESQLTGYSRAGCITYIELDCGVKHNPKALETIINYAMDKDIPYLAINVPLDTCLECGFTDEFNDKCPACGSTHFQQLRRVTGYITGDYKTAFNQGKQAEVQDRVRHD